MSAPVPADVTTPAPAVAAAAPAPTPARRVLGWARDAAIIGAVSLVALVGCELVARVIVHYRQDADPLLSRGTADAYGADAAWVPRFYAEQERSNRRVRWEPYVYLARLPFDGQHVQIDERGRRRTWQPPPRDDGAPVVKVHLYGASSLWGAGSRDDHTIPSAIAKALHERRPDVRFVVTSYAESAFVLMQNVIQLERELVRGEVPHIAIFYGGVNELVAVAQGGEPQTPMNEHNRRDEFNLLKDRSRLRREWLSRQWRGTGIYKLFFREEREAFTSPPWLQDPAERARYAKESAAAFARTVKVIEALGAGFGFETLFYAEPLGIEKRSLTPYEASLIDPARPMARFVRECYRGYREELAGDPRFHDLGALFADDTGPVFLDEYHLAEDGDRRVAERIVTDILPLVPKGRE